MTDRYIISVASGYVEFEEKSAHYSPHVNRILGTDAYLSDSEVAELTPYKEPDLMAARREGRKVIFMKRILEDGYGDKVQP